MVKTACTAPVQISLPNSPLVRTNSDARRDFQVFTSLGIIFCGAWYANIPVPEQL